MTRTPTLPTVLALADRPRETRAFERALSAMCDVLIANHPKEALRLMRDEFVQVVIAAGPWESSAQQGFLEIIRKEWPETVVLAILDADRLDEPDMETRQILARPFSDAELRTAVGTACEVFRLARENTRLTLQMKCIASGHRDHTPVIPSSGFENVLHTASSPMVSVVEQATQFASFDVPVLLLGEAGSGRLELARAIHSISLRADKPFQAVECRGLSDDALTLELFGARTPATKGAAPRSGAVKKTDQGTLYLHGVDALSEEMQARILRLAQTGLYEEQGAPESQRSNARLVTSAGPNLHDRVSDQKFRADLYYELSVAELKIPPLRDRRQDIAPIARHMLEQLTRQHGKTCRTIEDAAVQFLAAYDWPGNLRELENELTRMLIIARDGVIGPELLSRRILQSAPGDNADQGIATVMAAEGTLKDRIDTIEARILRETLTRLRWNKSRSAAELGLSRVGLRAKLERYGITPPTRTPEEA